MRQDPNTDSGSSKRGKLSSLIQKLQLIFDWSTVHILCAFDGTSYINTLSTNAAAASFILYPWPPGPQACALPRPAMNSRVMQAAHVGREQTCQKAPKKKKKSSQQRSTRVTDVPEAHEQQQRSHPWASADPTPLKYVLYSSGLLRSKQRAHRSQCCLCLQKARLELTSDTSGYGG